MNNTSNYIIPKQNWKQLLNDSTLNLTGKQKELLNKKILVLNEEKLFSNLSAMEFAKGYEESDSIYDNLEL